MCVPLLLKHSLEAARAYTLLLSRSVVHAHVQITVVGALGDAVYDGSIYTKGGHSVGRVVDGYFPSFPSGRAPAPRPLPAGCVAVCVVARASAFAACGWGEEYDSLRSGLKFPATASPPSPLHRFISLAPAPRLHDPTTVPDPGPAERREE